MTVLFNPNVPDVLSTNSFFLSFFFFLDQSISWSDEGAITKPSHLDMYRRAIREVSATGSVFRD
jgi:hypothetical protein